MRRLPLGALLLAVFPFITMCGCGGGGASGSAGSAVPPIGPAKQGKYFTHVVVMIQENRSFDNFFATFPGADGTRYGMMKVLLRGKYVDKRIKLTRHSLIMDDDLTHCHAAYETAYDDGKMDGFNLEHLGTCGAQAYAGRVPYQYVDPAQITPLLGRLPSSTCSPTISFKPKAAAVSSRIRTWSAAVPPSTPTRESPSTILSGPPLGLQCTAQRRNVAHYHPAANSLMNQGPSPCLTYPTGTLRDLLDKHHVTLEILHADRKPEKYGSAVMWSAFDWRSTPFCTTAPSGRRNIFDYLRTNDAPPTSRAERLPMLSSG